MNKTQLIIAIGLALQTSAGFGGYTFQAGTGQLSYTFFNLGPSNVTVTPYGSGANSAGQSGSNSISDGWDNSAGYYGIPGELSMFNSGLQTKTAEKYCAVDNSQYYVGGPIFFASNYDPVTTPSSFNLKPSNSQSVVEASGVSYEAANPPAMADSWTLSIDSTDNIVIANMASTSNLLWSWSGYATEWPFCNSAYGVWYNANINPPAPYNNAMQNSVPPGRYDSNYQETNPLGAGFVPTGQTMNLNVGPTEPNYSPTGGLWSGVNVTNGSNLAVNSINYSMYPINLSSYVQPNTGSSNLGFGSGAINGSNYSYGTQYYTSIYGGHFTLSIGDPYIISSFAAKMLWAWVTNPSYGFTDGSMDANDITTINGIVSGTFVSTSTPQQYASWLINSPNLAQSALSAATTASNTAITKESLWGKVVNGILKVGVDAGEAFAAIETGGSSLAVQMTVAGVNDATGAFGSDVTDAITNAATKVVSPPPPQAQNAPPVTNNTYASSNLFGLLLANSFVQAEVNIANNFTENTGSVLWNNASINVDGLCETSGINTVKVSNSLISGSCYTTNSSGTLNNGANGTSVTTFDNTSGQTAQSYTNPLSLSDSSQSTSQISLWNTILTGADITTNSSGVMQVGNPTLPAFSPPTQMATAGGISSPITNVNTTFNLSSGMMSVASYTSNGITTTSPPSASGGSTSVSTAWPTLTISGTPSNYVTLTGISNGDPELIFNSGGAYRFFLYAPWADCSQVLSTWCYSSSGLVTVNGYQSWNRGQASSVTEYQFSNGQLTLDMTTCAVGSSVNVNYDASNADYQNGSNMAGSLSCSTPLPAAPTGSYPVPTAWPILTVSTPSSGNGAYWVPFAQTTSPPATGTYYYDTSSGALFVNGYYGSSSTAKAYSFANDIQSISLTTCANDAVTLTLTPSTTSGNASGASGALSCGTPPTTTTWQPTITVVNAAASAANNTIQPANVAYNGTTLTVGGFSVNGGSAISFTNINPSLPTGALTLDTSTCNQSIIRSTLAYNSTSGYTTNYATVPLNVTLTVYPIGTSNASAMGVLSCQSPPTLSYNACTSDPNATGGVIAVLTGPALPNPQGPMFELACACVPPSPYMDGPNPVASNATTTQSNFTSNNFIATGGNDSNGNPNGVVVGATSTYPSQQCPTNW